MPDQAPTRPRHPDRPALPGAAYLIGIQLDGVAIDGDDVHALARTAVTDQLDTIAQDPEPDYGFIDLPSVCGQPARWAQTWGPWEVRSPILCGRVDICPDCWWRVAIDQGETTQLLDQLIVTGHDGAALVRACGEATLISRICRAILADTYDRDGETNLALQLLVHATRHRLVPLVRSEDCAEQSCDHDRQEDCYTGTAACRACTVHAGPWAGEWAGQSVSQCTVPGPCGVPATLADTYQLTIGR